MVATDETAAAAAANAAIAAIDSLGCHH